MFHIYIEPRAGTAPILQLIDQAKSQIDLNAYYIDNRSILDALHQAVQRGVRVRVILERHPYKMPPFKIRREFREIQSTGAQVKSVLAGFALDHAKMIVGRMAAFFGSQNFSWHSLNKNREMGLLFNNPSALSLLESQFDKDWLQVSAQ